MSDNLPAELGYMDETDDSLPGQLVLAVAKAVADLRYFWAPEELEEFAVVATVAVLRKLAAIDAFPEGDELAEEIEETP